MKNGTKVWLVGKPGGKGEDKSLAVVFVIVGTNGLKTKDVKKFAQARGLRATTLIAQDSLPAQ